MEKLSTKLRHAWFTSGFIQITSFKDERLSADEVYMLDSVKEMTTPPFCSVYNDLGGVMTLKDRSQRVFLIVVGWLSIVLGLIGAFLPLLPTTPFLLLAAACFARSSPRLYERMLNHPWIGPTLKDWRENRVIPLRAKILAISMITVSMGSSIALFIPHWLGRISMTAIGVSVCVYLISIPTRRN